MKFLRKVPRFLHINVSVPERKAGVAIDEAGETGEVNERGAYG